MAGADGVTRIWCKQGIVKKVTKICVNEAVKL